MNVKDFFDALNGGARWDIGVSINRSNSLPLDANSVFASLADAQNYAAGTPAEGTLANAYPGQVLAVVTDSATTIYYIDANMSLKPLGDTTDIMAYIGEIPEDSDAESIIEYIENSFVKKDGSKGLSTNDLTDELKANYDAAYEYATTKHAPDDAEKNYISSVDEEFEVEDGKLKLISVPHTKVTGLTSLFQGKADKDDFDDLCDTVIGIPTEVPETGETVYSGGLVSKVEALEKAGFQNKTQVEGIVNAAIAGISHPVFEKVETIPNAADATDNVLYLVPSEVTGHLDIYAKISGEMVLIDDTDTDLSGFYTSAQVDEIIGTYSVVDESGDLPVTVVEPSGIRGDIEEAKGIAEIANMTANSILHVLTTETNPTLQELVEANLDQRITTLEEDYIHLTDVGEYLGVDEGGILDININGLASEIIGNNNLITEQVLEDQYIGELPTADGKTQTVMQVIDGLEDVYVKKHGTDRLITEAEAAKLAGLVVDPDTGETSLPISGQISMLQVDGLLEKLDGKDGVGGKVDKVEGKGLSTNDFTDTLLEKLNNIEAEAQVNIIEAIKIGNTELSIVDKTVAIPVASNTVLGVVIGSGDENKISIEDDGTMEVNSLNVNRLVQTEGEYLELSGGNASI